MKLRIRDNTLRLRLTQGEVTQLRETGLVTAAIAFGPGQRLTYALQAEAHVATLQAHFDGDRITVTIPTSEAHTWADTDQVGLASVQPLGDGQTLDLLIEKDFRCLTPRGAEDADAFPHPADHC